MTSTTNTPVEVDPGDLMEVQQAAEAWASYLRKRATEKAEMGIMGIDPTQDEKAADRIDQANHRLREQTYPKV